MLTSLGIGTGRSYNALGQSGNSYSNISWPNAEYFADLDETWFVFDRADGAARDCYVRVYDHAAGAFRDAVKVDDMTLLDDEHGYPCLCRDSNGRVLVFYDSHTSSGQIARTTDPNDETSWSLLAATADNMTYPNPVTHGTNVYLFYRGSPLRYAAYIRSAATAGAPSWSTEKRIVDLDDSGQAGDERCYLTGNFAAIGDDIHMQFMQTDWTVVNYTHVYYAIFDTTTDEIRNMEGTATFTSANQPIDISDMNASFRAFAHQGSNRASLNCPTAYDDDNYPHIAVYDGDTGSWDLKFVRWTGTEWETSVIEAAMPFASGLALFRVGDNFGLIYGQDLQTWTRGESHLYYREWDGSTWSVPRRIARSGKYSLMFPGAVRNGHADAKVTFSEVTSAETVEGGNCRGFAWSPTKGFLRGG